MAVLTAALLATTLAVPALQHAEMNGSANHGWLADVRGYLRNPIDYLAQRSPGARAPGQLIQSKHHMAKLPRNAVQPHEQVLSNVRYGSPITPFINDIVPGPGLIDFSAPIPAIGPVGVNGGLPGAPGTPVVPVSVPAGTSPGGTPTGTTVPESSTWLMLIWGMALVGFGLRSSHRNRQPHLGFRVQA